MGLLARDRVLDQLLRTVYGAQIANQVAEEQRDATLRHCYSQVLDQIARGASHVRAPAIRRPDASSGTTKCRFSATTNHNVKPTQLPWCNSFRRNIELLR